MLIYCFKCKKKTPSSDLYKTTSSNRKIRASATCDYCLRCKSVFCKGNGLKLNPVLERNNLLRAEEVHRPVIKRFAKRRIITLGIDDLWAADLIIMTKYVSENDDYKYLLNVIDTFSKYVWAEPLKKKSGEEVAKAFGKILDKSTFVNHKPPNFLHTDKGREFINRDFKQLLKEQEIKLYHTENEEKSSIVERFNRTLNQKMKVQFELRQSFRWVDLIQDLINKYNNTFHSTIKMKPSEVNKSNEQQLRNLYANKDTLVIRKPKFQVGDRVRITIKKDVFANKYRRNWTREIFTVTNVLRTEPVTYRISDGEGEEILGSFYELELQKSKF